MGLELLEQDIRRNFEKNIRHEENRQCSVVFRSGCQAQLRLESENGGITDVNTMQQESSMVSVCVTKTLDEERNIHTDPKMQADTGHTSMARCANRSWPSTCARWCL
jgi:hypothetical protein